MEGSLKLQRASLEKQRQAIHQQMAQRGDSPVHFAENAVFYAPLSMVPSQLDCPRLTTEKVNELVSPAARKQSLDPAILTAVIKQESGFKPCAVSSMGAQGLMQLMPATARGLNVTNVFDPVQNVQAGAAYLKQLLNRYQGDLPLALVGYNAGPGRADQGADTPYPAETQNYVASILADLGIDSAPNTLVGAREDPAPDQDPRLFANPKIAIQPVPMIPALSEQGTRLLNSRP